MLRNLSSVVLLALASIACQAAPGTAWKSTARLSVSVLDDYEAEGSAQLAVDDQDIDYESVDLAFGGLRYSNVGEGLPYPDLLVEFGLGFVGLQDELIFDPGGGGAPFPIDLEADALEFALGFRRYLFGEDLFERWRLLPYFGLAGVHTEIEDLEGRGQLGLRVSSGLQLFIGTGGFLDLGVDYTHPLIAAESEFEPALMDELDVELSGFALRIGAGVIF